MTFDRSPAPAPSRQRPLATRRWRYAVALAAIVALAWLARGSFLAHQQGCDAFTWSDPDGYLLKARALAPTPRSWQWSHAAVAYQDYVKAPGYPVFLSLFRGFGRGFEAAAAIAQILLGGVGVIAAWQLGRALAGRRAGLLAAVAHALWFPAIGSTAAFLQEQLYVPLLLLAAALFVRAVSLRAPPRSFAAAGLAFGAAALVRSLPLYLALPLALVHVVVARDRRRAVTQAAGFLAGLVLVVTPYVAFISFQEGRLVPIENVGSFMLARSQTGGLDARGIAGSAQLALDALGAVEPAHLASAMLAVGSRPWLWTQARADTPGAAWTLKLLAHGLGDLPWLIVLALAPLGLVRARHRGSAVCVLVIAAMHVVLAALAGYAGARFRGPAEPLLAVLAAAALMQSPRLPRPAMLAAGTLGLVLAALAAGSLPLALAAWPDQGVSQWQRVEGGRRAQTRPIAAFNLLPYPGPARAVFTPLDAASPPNRLELRSDAGQQVVIQLESAPLMIELQTLPGTRTRVLLQADAPLQLELQDRAGRMRRAIEASEDGIE